MCGSANASREGGPATLCSARSPPPANPVRSSRRDLAERQSRPPLISQPKLSLPPLSSAKQCHTWSSAMSQKPSRHNSISRTRAPKLFRDNPPQASLQETLCLQSLFRSHRTPDAIALRRAHPSAATPSDSLASPSQNLL